ncbi:hypothetical protein ACRYCC_30915 [Actinomadura scrupuli]|uniref:hypothetical protein n=1 Tax=Actinomadura scrupuli TaxID=559629 RepID=UPI003D98FC42
MAELIGESNAPYVPGVTAINSDQSDHAGFGLHAKSRGAAVVGESTTWMGVYGHTESTWGGHGVNGIAKGGGCGVAGEADMGIGVYASTSTGNTALHAEHKGGGHAGYFIGHVSVTNNLLVGGDVQLQGADLAEQFQVMEGEDIDAGSVVVLADHASLRLSSQAYDRHVVGVVSGAGNYRPGIVLDRQDAPGRRPIALTGKVWCKVDADSSPIEFGQMLTTSPTPGHAMGVTDMTRAFGAVIGKALAGLGSGRGLIPVLVTLQ